MPRHLANSAMRALVCLALLAALTPGQGVLTASFATRGSRLQIPSNPPPM
jgi:hypothetical protein